MKAYRIKVETHYGMASWKIVSMYDDSYNSFDTLKEAKQFALDNIRNVNPVDLQGCRDRIKATTLEEVFEDYFRWIEILESEDDDEGEDDSPSSPLSDGAIYDLMTSLKDSWHHFRADDIKGSLKNVAGKVFYKIKKYCNPDLDWEAMAEETWMDQSYLGSWTMFPEPEEEDNFNEYVANWKYPRKEVA